MRYQCFALLCMELTVRVMVEHYTGRRKVSFMLFSRASGDFETALLQFGSTKNKQKLTLKLRTYDRNRFFQVSLVCSVAIPITLHNRHSGVSKYLMLFLPILYKARLVYRRCFYMSAVKTCLTDRPFTSILHTHKMITCVSLTDQGRVFDPSRWH